MAEESEVIHFDDDSVPSDFFDDFSNQDFMAGLDVVDETWSDKEEESTTEPKSTTEQKEKPASTDNNKKKTNSKRSRRRKRSWNKTKRSRSGDTFKKIRIDSDDILKRDPEKSKRDIQKDKDKWTKHNEAKIISERLKVVETGLVPPGTEMDIDLKEMRSIVNLPDLREKLRKKSPPKTSLPKKSRSRSFDLSTRLTRRNRNREQKNSPSRKRSRSHSRTRDRRHPISPVRRVSRSPRRSISPYSRRSSSDRHMSREHRDRYRVISPSVKTRRYSRPRSPGVSGRESWARNHNFRRMRSPSPFIPDDRRRNPPKDFLEELADKLKYDDKKKKILQEISHKLNEPVRPINHNQMFPPGPDMRMVPGSVSGPLPGPGLIPTSPATLPLRPPQQNNFFHAVPVRDPAPQYDQSFFIGQPTFPSPNNTQVNTNPFPPPYMRNNFQPTPTNPIPKIVPQSGISPATNSVHRIVNPVKLNDGKRTEVQREEDKKAATKLLEDKTISLSDFLSMSAKYNAGSSKPINIHKKVKVLAQCQDVLKTLGNASRLNGRFFFTGNKNIEKPPILKGLSPLRKIPVTRFTFTTPWKGTNEKVGPQPPLQKLMASLGLSFKVAEVEPTRSTSPVSTGSELEYVPPTPMVPQVQTIVAPIAGVRFQTKLTQTHETKCEQCEARKAIKRVPQGTQYNVSTVSCSTQITDADLQRFGLKPSVVGGLKKSLNHLTPAQLLGKDDPPQRREHFTAPQMVAPPAASMVSEKGQDFDLFLGRGVKAESVSKLPSLIDELKSSMKVYEQTSSRRHASHDTLPYRRDSIEREVRISGFNRVPEYRERSPVYIQQQLLEEERMHQMFLAEQQLQMQRQYFESPERNLRMQERLIVEEHMRAQQSYFDPLQGRDDHMYRGYM